MNWGGVPIQQEARVRANMAKYDQCERCGKPRGEELLSPVDYWLVSESDRRRIPSYWWVCQACFEDRKIWCPNLFPDTCEHCGIALDIGDYCLESEFNRDGRRIQAYGLAPDEACRILCEACYKRAEEP